MSLTTLPDRNKSKVSKYEAASADIWLARWCSAGAGSVLLVLRVTIIMKGATL